MRADTPTGTAAQGGLARGTVPLVALCAGVTVANIYLAHPILTLLAEAFGVPESATGFVVTVAQVGYALGLFFLVPLGDVVRRRRLVAVLVSGTGAALLLAAAAGALPVLVGATVVLSLLTVVPHVLIPFTVAAVDPDRRGRSLALINAGMTAGIVGSRVIGGAVGDLLGWRAVYLVAAVATVVVGLLTAFVLPAEPVRERPRFDRLVASTLRFLRTEPGVRWAIAIQIPVFAAFNFVWVMLVLLLTGPVYGLSVGTAGLFGLFSLVTLLSAPLVGRLLDARGSAVVLAGGLAVQVVGAALMLASEHGMVFVCVAIVLLTIGQQSSQIANQTRILALRPEARSRINTLYMTGIFIGGAAASAVAALVHGAFGWSGVTVGTFACAVAAALVGLAERLTAGRRPAAVAP
ncbi:MFS transporter [Pseudonocardia zijingensis]|uniref:MFS transporter n=1 Tax=Pseudonocardia zijingensis TaxID=153376 RepID=A0ABN1Q153_9PSEU